MKHSHLGLVLWLQKISEDASGKVRKRGVARCKDGVVTGARESLREAGRFDRCNERREGRDGLCECDDVH